MNYSGSQSDSLWDAAVMCCGFASGLSESLWCFGQKVSKFLEKEKKKESKNTTRKKSDDGDINYHRKS